MSKEPELLAIEIVNKACKVYERHEGDGAWIAMELAYAELITAALRSPDHRCDALVTALEAFGPFAEYLKQLRERFPESTHDTIIVGGPYNLTYAHFDALAAALAAFKAQPSEQGYGAGRKEDVAKAAARLRSYVSVFDSDDNADELEPNFHHDVETLCKAAGVPTPQTGHDT